jgi:NADH-quinone oxidoreductase subunit H
MHFISGSQAAFDRTINFFYSAHSVSSVSSVLAEKGDPLFKGKWKIDEATGEQIASKVDWWGWPLIILLGKVLVAFGLLVISTAMSIWYLRKFIADMQNRIGPNRAGPFGLLQSLADGTKLFFKEALFPTNAEKTVFRLAPYIAAVPAFLTFCVIPLGGSIDIAGYRTFLQVAEPPMGVLFSLAISSIAVYGVMLAGWASGSKYPLMGSVRASAQMISYEAALGLSLTAVVLVTGSLSTRDIVDAQSGWRWNAWMTIFVPFIVFAIAACAELNHPPFDLVEAESELVGGFHTEYSGARFAMFYLAEFMNQITMSALVATLFLGGPNMPFDLGAILRLDNVPGIGGFLAALVGASSPLWLALKVFLLVSVLVGVRATLPRLRYDQLMDLGWKRMIPLSLMWLLILAANRIGDNRFERLRNTSLALAGCAVATALLLAAMRVGRKAAQEEFAEISTSAQATALSASPGSRAGRL